jgi:hypothetical protein
MVLTLAQAETLSETDLRRGVLETFVIESPFMEMLDFMEIEGNAYAYNEEATLPQVQFRAVNQAYSESTGTVNQRSERLVILGGDADVDKFIQLTRSNLNDQRALQLTLKAKALVYRFQDAFINGDVAVDANSFDGLKKRLVGPQRLNVAQINANGIPINGTLETHGERHAFLDQLDRLIAAVPDCDILLMNGTALARFQSAARRLGIGQQERNDFGRLIDFYNNIPIYNPGTRADGTDIITATETFGTATDSSSIYAVRFGEDPEEQSVQGLTNGWVQVEDFGELQTAPAYRHRLEWYCGVGIFGGKAAARLEGVRAA